MPLKIVFMGTPDFSVPVLDAVAAAVGARGDGERAAALELALEALYLARRIDKTATGAETVYG